MKDGGFSWKPERGDHAPDHIISSGPFSVVFILSGYLISQKEYHDIAPVDPDYSFQAFIICFEIKTNPWH